MPGFIDVKLESDSRSNPEWLQLFVEVVITILSLALTKFSQEKLDAWTTVTFYYQLLMHPVFLFNPFPIQSVRLPLVTYPWLCSTYMTYGTLCHAIGHQVLLIQPLPMYPGKQRISLGVTWILRMCLCLHA